VDFVNLKAGLKDSVFPAYVIYGSDIYLLYKSVSLITDAITASGAEAEQIKFDETAALNNVVAACNTPSFFADKRIVIYKPNEKMTAAEINNYIKNPNPDCVLVIMVTQEKNTTGIKGAAEINCNPIASPEVLMGLIAKQMSPKRITQGGARYLVDATGGNYALIDNELNKIINFYEDIELIDIPQIAEFITKTADYQIYELTKAILQNRAAECEKIYDYLNQSGIAEYAVFGGVLSGIRRAWYSAATKCEQNELGKFLGVSPYSVSYSRKDYAGKVAAISQVYEVALNLEYKIKSGLISVANAISYLILN
jgi:DNA polymerase-3 subunit delta